jgi:hypothetical protein
LSGVGGLSVMDPVNRETVVRMARLLMAVDIASREDATAPKHDETTCHVCAENAAARA